MDSRMTRSRILPDARALLRGGCLFLFALLLAACDRAQGAKPGAEKPPEAALRAVEGKPFPKIVLQYASGSSLSTQSFHGKLVVLNVWATWCPPCRREMPDLQQLSRTLDPARFAVIGVSTDQDALLAEEFLQQRGISFPNFFDQGGHIAKQLGMQVYPETFVIAPDGVLLHRVAGLREWSAPQMVAWLEDAYRNHAKQESHEQ
jgi:thiol-disulfide isomerase/thioredoxin